MNYVAIPSEVFDSREYKGLSIGSREFLLRLYHYFGDCDTFLVDYQEPESYGEKRGKRVHAKLKTLVDAGFITIKDKPEIESRGPRPRILTFTYPAVEAYQ